MKKTLKRLALVVATFLLLGLLGEGAVRLYSYFFHPKMMRLDDRLGWVHAAELSKVFPNERGEDVLVVSNRHGNRGTDHPFDRTPGKARVLVLGDSFTEAIQVPEEALFTTLLERGIDDVEVVNTGVGGYGTVQEFLYYRDVGSRFRPDLVLLVVFENDLTDNLLSYYPTIGPRPYASVDERGKVELHETLNDEEYLDFCPGIPFAGFFARNSYLFFVFQEKVYQEFRRDELVALHERRMNALDTEKQLLVFADVVRRLRAEVEDEGGQLLVALVPSRKQANRAEAPILERIEALLVELSLDHVSLLPALAAAVGEGRQPYFEKDIHWSRDGHAIVAEALRAPIAKRLERSTK